ncbi:hypothetical protein [Frisingicoccus sp.]|uniref:hypothetical protein n=1 Tax=Frisingicoccus sp. TaxID=1918627 RepID=UPI003AB4BF5F
MKKLCIAGLIVVEGLSVGLWLRERAVPETEVTAIERNLPGEGSSEVDLEVHTSLGAMPFHLDVGERAYSAEELETVFAQGKAWLDSVWLGENASPEKVTEDLYFPDKIENTGIAVRWIPENSRWVQYDGGITEEARSEAPAKTRVRAVLKYGTEERGYDYELTIEKPELEGGALLRQSIQADVLRHQAENPSDETFLLPASVGEETLTWYVPKKSDGLKVFVFGNLLVVLFYLSYEDRKFQKNRQRERELAADYPDIVYRMILLVSSGMTVRGAWEKMVQDYCRWRHSTGKRRWGYEEMENGLREMNYGVPELTVYENFGSRCGTRGYIRFAALLIQQVRRGARGMNEILAREVGEAEVARRENGRKATEESASRLLFPMLLLMMVVFAVLMIPAFLSMHF